MRRTLAPAAVGVLLAVSAGLGARQEPGRISSFMSGANITDVAGIKVGHETLTGRPTGCTVILAEAGAVAGVDVRGSAPGTIETDLLDPVNLVQQVHAVFLSGGSAFGLDVATGVRKYLYERKIGFETRVAKVPIVPGAIIFDLGVGERPDIWPTAECGYRAAAAAKAGLIDEGNVGAGAGATVGKLGGGVGSMKGGLGTTAISAPSGTGMLIVGAIVAVNAVGDVIDPQHGRDRGWRPFKGRGLCRCAQAHSHGTAAGDQGGSEHHDWRGRDQREAHQGAGHQSCADGAGWAGACDLSRAHDG